MARKMVQTELIKLRADPLTVEKLDRLAEAAGGNRSEIIRQLIDRAAGSIDLQLQQRQPWPTGAIIQK